MENVQLRAISIDEVVALKAMPADFFVKLSDTKFVLIAKKGAPPPVAQLQKLQAKKVDSVYVRSEDYLLARGSSGVEIAGVTVERRPANEKFPFTRLEKVAVEVFKSIDEFGFNTEIVNASREISETTLVMATSHNEIQKLLDLFSTLSSDEEKHVLMVSSICVMIGCAFDWTSRSTLEKLALGGFLHDVGKTKIPHDIAIKSVYRMTPDERVIYRTHIDSGREMLTKIKDLPDDVELMVYEHHELADGSGFPRGMRDLKISPMGRICSIANAFTELALKETPNPTRKGAERALQELETKRGSQFNPDCMKALKKLIET